MATQTFLARLRSRLTSRGDTEHEQAGLRLAVGVVLFLYLLPHALGEYETNLLLLAAMACYLALCAAVFGWIYARPQPARARRVFAAFLDIGSTSAFMYYLGESGAVLYSFYLLIMFGHGFRYGKPYLYNALGLSILGFGLVLSFNDYWIENRTLGLGLLVGMILLALWVGKMVTRLFDSLHREEAANQAKRRFLSTVSHEMRTPLTAIIGMNDLLQDTPLSAEQAEMVKAMHEASQSMLKLIEDVLDISKIEAGKVSIEETDFDLHSLINGTAVVLGSQAEIRGLQFRAHVMPEVPHALRGDPYHLRQVLYNLIGNGIKFTQAGSVTLTVSSLAESEHAVRLRFAIEDTGIGIAPDAQDRIFESFTQADESTTRRYGGTGLGTTISKQLVEMMGGHIGLQSTLGKGSTFWFELQLKKQVPGQAEGSFRLNDIRIMLLGFADAELRMIEQDLGTWGARTGREAGVEAAAARLAEAQSLGHPYHLVLVREGENLDPVRMVARLKGPRGQKCPPLALCTRGLSGDRSSEALASGFAAALEMPYKKRLLFNAIHSATAIQESQEGVISLSDYYAARDANRRRYQILVAEDNAVNQRVIVGILERAGHRVRVVGNGEQALDVLENERFDAVIMDLNMPELGGLDAARAYRFMDPEAIHVPIIMLSADVTSEARKECEEAGIDAFLSKPVEARRLLDTIANLISKRASAQAAAVQDADESQAATLNPAALAELELIGSGSTFMPELINGFVQDGEALLRQMDAAIAAKQYSTLKDLVHAMKGSAATLGADQLCKSCVGINAQTTSELEASGARVLKLLREHFQQARASLLEYLKKSQSAAR